MSTKATTYEKYLQLVSGSSGIKISKEESGIIIDRFRSSHDAPSHYAPVTYILDYTSKKYFYVDEACYNLLGYKVSNFMEGGLEYYTNKLHPLDFEVLNKKIFPVNFDFIKQVPVAEYPDYIFSYNHRSQNVKGEYVKVLQRHSFIPGQNNELPAGVIGVVFNISHFKADDSITHTIEKTVSCNGSIVNELILKKTYPVYNSSIHQKLSDRELEILKHMADGFNSKQIAGKLNLSINTISNHRKNMLKKMDCKTSSQLLKKIINDGIL
jgi:DNA-binding CsgD family transcriptional regulator